MSISWSFFKKTADNACPALTTEYMDTTAQQIYISENGRIVSTYGQIDAGNWEGAVFGENTDIGGADSAMFRATHEYNGEIWASCGNQILRYKYIQDISDLIISADTADTSDSPIRDISVSLRRPDEGMIDDYTTLFCVGGKITVDLMMGDSAKERIITAYCDEHDWSQTDNAMTVRARNAIGYFLSDATFDERTKYTGTRKGILYQMLEYSGIPLYTLIIENDTTEVEYEFKYNDRKFDKIKSLLTEWGWKIAELPDGKVLIGSQTLFNTYAPKGTHTYDKNTQGFEYHIVQRVDSSYSRIAVVSASEETNGEPIIEYRDLSTFRGWGLPKKTKYIDTLAGTPREIVAALADEYKKAYDNIGVTAEIRCPVRPCVAPGDLAVFANADVYSYIQRGIITSVRHTYGVSGVMTRLTVDSGGTVIVGADGRVSTYTAADVDGDTRRREMLDEINRSANSTVIAYSNLSESGGGKETDPTVPSWAKQPEKPKYTAAEVGADSAGSADSALTAAKKYTDEKVKTNVPENALFTDTVYDDKEIKAALNNEATARANGDGALQDILSDHVNDTSNPHSVTKAQVGLGNVDNTSDADKPISTAMQTALYKKFDKSGGTISGDSFGFLELKRNTEWQASIKFSNTKGNLGYIGMKDIDGDIIHTFGADTSKQYPMLDSNNYKSIIGSTYFPQSTITTATDLNTLKTTGIYHIKVGNCTNVPTSDWGTLFVDFSTGTPYQIYIADGATMDIYKRQYANSSWGSWVYGSLTSSTTIIVKAGESIQSAIDSLPSTGGKIILAAGTHSVTSKLTCNKNVIFEGMGAGTIINVTNHAFLYNTTSGRRIVLKNMTMNLTGTLDEAYGFINAVSDLIIDNCTISAITTSYNYTTTSGARNDGTLDYIHCTGSITITNSNITVDIRTYSGECSSFIGQEKSEIINNTKISGCNVELYNCYNGGSTSSTSSKRIDLYLLRANGIISNCRFICRGNKANNIYAISNIAQHANIVGCYIDAKNDYASVHSESSVYTGWNGNGKFIGNEVILNSSYISSDIVIGNKFIKTGTDTLYFEGRQPTVVGNKFLNGTTNDIRANSTDIIFTNNWLRYSCNVHSSSTSLVDNNKIFVNLT